MAVQSDIVLRRLRKLPEISFQEELRGYSKQQVDRVLESLMPAADEIENLHARVAEAETRAAAAEARLLEIGGRESDLAPQPEPAPPVEPILTAPPDFDETLRNTLLLAQRTADETVRQARHNADTIAAEATVEAERLVSAARAEAAQLEQDIEARRVELAEDIDTERRRLMEEAREDLAQRRSVIEDELKQAEGAERDALANQIDELQQTRDLLATEIESLEEFLGTRRSSIQTALDDLAAVISDPAQLAAVPTPEITDTAVAPAVHAEVSVPSEALSALEGELASTPAAAPDLPPAEEGAATAPEQPDGEIAVSETAVSDTAVDEAPAPVIEEAADELDPDDPFAGGVLLGGEAETDGFAGPDDDLDGPSRGAGPTFAQPDNIWSGEATQEIHAVGAEGPADNGDAEAGGAGNADGDTGDADDTAETTGPITRPPWAESVPDIAELPLQDEPERPVQDPFLDQLRRATSGTDEEGDDDALDRFLEGSEEEEAKPSWFGRRK